MTARAETARILQTTEKNVPARVVAMKLSDPCGRCGGSGNYSFNQMDGSRCYGCGGRGHVAPQTDAEWARACAAAVAAVESGKLAEYLRAVDGRRVAATARVRVLDAWSKSQNNGKIELIRSSHLVPSEDVTGLAELRAANEIMHAAFQRVSDATRAAQFPAKGADTQALWAKIPALVETALSEIAAADASTAGVELGELPEKWARLDKRR